MLIAYLALAGTFLFIIRGTQQC